jgi:hypothetical protein
LFEDVLCFSKAKHRLLIKSETSHTPVKINRFTKTDDGSKLIINNMTSVSVADQAEYSFQYTERAETITEVKTILEDEDAYNMVNICSGVIKLQIWQENIAKIVVINAQEQQPDITLTFFGNVLSNLVDNLYLLQNSVVAKRLLMVGPVSITFNRSTNVVIKANLL